VQAICEEFGMQQVHAEAYYNGFHEIAVQRQKQTRIVMGDRLGWTDAESDFIVRFMRENEKNAPKFQLYEELALLIPRTDKSIQNRYFYLTQTKRKVKKVRQTTKSVKVQVKTEEVLGFNPEVLFGEIHKLIAIANEGVQCHGELQELRTENHKMKEVMGKFVKEMQQIMQ
jgi:hypothetical protein